MSSSKTRVCQSCNNPFVIEPEDFSLLGQLDLQPGLNCSRCIWKNMMAFWIFGTFRKAKSALSGKTIITTFSEKPSFPIYAHDEWLSDSWDPLSYGQSYDPKRSFFEQFHELQAKVPHPHCSGANNSHSEWCDDAWSCKNCYLCRSMLDCEDVSYGYRVIRGKNSIDVAFCFDIELSYDCIYCFKCYRVKYAFDVRDSIESSFLYDCRNVQNCFMCWNLRNKQYHILNKPYSKEAYHKKLEEYDLRSFKSVERLKKTFEEIVAREAVHRTDYNINAIHSTGNYLEDCKNCADSFLIQESENSRHVLRGFKDKNVIYGTGTIGEKMAYSMMDGYGYETAFTSRTTRCRYSTYLDYCEECEYCFGCVGLRKKKYCILNKQYTKEEYERMVSVIKERMRQQDEWGKFFPYELAYGGYNESIASHYFPLAREEALSAGIQWEDPSDIVAVGKRDDDIPDRIEDADESISKEQLICAKTNRKFNIAPHEFEFLKNEGIPLPRYHFDHRTLERFRPLTSVSSYQGKCFRCKNEIVHFYPPEWGYQKVLCLNCYHAEVA
jgi:hypothetical protein